MQAQDRYTAGANAGDAISEASLADERDGRTTSGDTARTAAMLTTGPSSPVRAVLAALAERGFAATAPRRQIVQCFLRHAGTVTAADLYTLLRGQGSGIGLVTIYRTLDLLVECGLAHVIASEDGSQQERHFLPCELSARHHHHLICTACGGAQDITDCGLDALERNVALQSGYRIDHHALTFFGRCPACQ